MDVVFGDRLRPPRARFTCRCGYVVAEGRSAGMVRLFVEEVPAAHRAVCTLSAGQLVIKQA